MSEIRDYTVYKFDELTAEQQAEALDNYRWIETEHDWYYHTVEDQTDKLENLGYRYPEIQFTGFASQGNGASFTCKFVDVPKWLKAHKLAGKYRALFNTDLNNYEVEIHRMPSHYVHDMTMSVSGQWYGETSHRAEDQLDTVSELILEDAQALARDIYRDLETEYDYLTSDEAVAECLRANDYDFTTEGRID